MIFYRAEEHRILELLLNLSLGRVFRSLQRSFRRKMGRKFRAKLREAKRMLVDVISKPVHSITLRELDAAVSEYSNMLGARPAAPSPSPYSVPGVPHGSDSRVETGPYFVPG